MTMFSNVPPEMTPGSVADAPTKAVNVPPVISPELVTGPVNVLPAIVPLLVTGPKKGGASRVERAVLRDDDAFDLGLADGQRVESVPLVQVDVAGDGQLPDRSVKRNVAERAAGDGAAEVLHRRLGEIAAGDGAGVEVVHL